MFQTVSPVLVIELLPQNVTVLTDITISLKILNLLLNALSVPSDVLNVKTVPTTVLNVPSTEKVSMTVHVKPVCTKMKIWSVYNVQLIVKPV
jgi:hypothetical protein